MRSSELRIGEIAHNLGTSITRRQMLKRIGTLSLAASSLAGLLSACSAPTGSPTTPPAVVPKSETSAGLTPTAVQAGASATPAAPAVGASTPPKTKASSPVVLRWWHWAGAHVETQKKLVAEYQKQFDGNVSVEITAFPNVDQQKVAVKTALLGEGGPDIVASLPGADTVGYALANNFLTYDETFRAEPAWAQSFFPFSRNLTTVNEKVWSVVPVVNAVGIWYNKALLAKHNLKVPASIEELKRAGEVLRAAGIIPLGLAGGQDSTQPMFPFFWAVSGLGGGNTMRQADLGKTPWTSPELVQAMQIVDDLVKSSLFQPGVLGVKEPDNIGLLATGKAAMLLTGNFVRNGLTKALQPGVEVGFAPLPAVKAGGLVTALASIGLPMSVNRASKNADVALELVRFMTRDRGKLSYSGGVGVPPNGPVDPASEKELAAMVNDPSWGDCLAVQRQANGLRDIFTPSVFEALSQATQSVLSGRATPEVAMQQVEAVSKQAGTRNFQIPDWKFA